MSEQFRITLEKYPMEWIVKLCEAQGKHLELLRSAFSYDVVMRDNELHILSEDAVTFHSIESIVKALFNMMEAYVDVSGRDIEYACRLAELSRLQELSTTYQEAIGKTVNGKLIYPKAIGQRHLFKCMCDSEIVFVTGTTGTGRTYLIVVYTVSLLRKGEIRKIILTKPAVETGGNLGFLPGDLEERVDPYLRPFYDVLYDTLGQEQMEKLLEKEVVEAAPLAYMCGRTLDSIFVILDEAQSTIRTQMRMFLTRVGFHSRTVITGDVTQVDLIKKRDSGLLNAKHLLSGIEGIPFVELTGLDIAHNPSVQKIIERYEQEEERYDKDFIDRR